MLRTIILAAAVASASAFAPMAGFGRTATKARTGATCDFPLRSPSRGLGTRQRASFSAALEQEQEQEQRRRRTAGEIQAQDERWSWSAVA